MWLGFNSIVTKPRTRQEALHRAPLKYFDIICISELRCARNKTQFENASNLRYSQTTSCSKALFKVSKIVARSFFAPILDALYNAAVATWHTRDMLSWIKYISRLYHVAKRM